MTPTVEHALAKFQNAPKERQEKLAKIMLVELEDVRDDYQEFVDQRLAQAAVEIKEGKGIPAKEAFAQIRSEMKTKYGQV